MYNVVLMIDTKERFKLIPAAYLILQEGNTILLQQRSNTGYKDGWYSLPAGHLDGNESATNGMIREANEEIGIKLNSNNLTLKLTMHRISPDRECVDWFFTANNWEGDIQNKEPQKCSDLSFFSIDKLPKKTIPYIVHAIESIQQQLTFTEFGWNNQSNTGFN